MKPHVVLVHFAEGPQVDWREWVESAQALAQVRAAGLRHRAHLVRTPEHRMETARRIIAEPPRVVFLAVGRLQVPAALAFLNDLRGIHPQVHILVGGTWGTFCSHEFTATEQIHAVLLGEWTEALAEYSQTLSRHNDPGEVPGTFLRGLKGWRLTEQRLYEPRLQDWPDPEFDGLRPDDLMELRAGSLPILASRGFPFQSLFSTEPLLRHLQKSDLFYHLRPPERVAAEAKALRGRYHAQSFDFVDDVFPWIAAWQEKFAENWLAQVARPFRIRSAAEYMTEESVKVLRRAGLTAVELSVETGDEVLRRRMSDLNQTNERLYEAVETLRRHGVETRLRLMVGVPGETPQSLRETVEMARIADATETAVERFIDWPESGQWARTESHLTGGTTVQRMRLEEQSAIARDIAVAMNDIEVVDSLNRARSRRAASDVHLDAVAAFPDAIVRSPFEGGARIRRLCCAGAEHAAIALRIPTRISWEIELPGDASIHFGILLEPRLPGERVRQPVSFSILADQNGRTLRLFQKVLLQALDPDSRTHHRFRIPLAGLKRGPVLLSLENTIVGMDIHQAPDGDDIWCGWTDVCVRASQIKQGE